MDKLLIILKESINRSPSNPTQQTTRVARRTDSTRGLLWIEWQQHSYDLRKTNSMTVRTRGSTALDKAQRRLALLKAIDAKLDLGHGLTVEAYDQAIAKTRAALEAHNTLQSEIEESRKTVTELDRFLSELSGRMLSGVATRYGRGSMEYVKAGGSAYTRRGRNTPPKPYEAKPPETDSTPDVSAM